MYFFKDVWYLLTSFWTLNSQCAFFWDCSYLLITTIKLTCTYTILNYLVSGAGAFAVLWTFSLISTNASVAWYDLSTIRTYCKQQIINNNFILRTDEYVNCCSYHEFQLRNSWSIKVLWKIFFLWTIFIGKSKERRTLNFLWCWLKPQTKWHYQSAQ